MQDILLHTLEKVETELGNNNLKEAEYLASIALRMDPNNLYSLHIMGVIKGLLGQPKEACSYFYKAIKSNVDDPKLLFNYSKALYELKKFRESIIFIEKTLQISPNNYDVWINYGNCLNQLERYDAALDAYHKALTLNPLSTDILGNIATTLIHLQRFEEAQVFCKKIIEVDKNIVKAWQLLGEASYKTGNYRQAVEAYDQVSIIQPSNLDAVIAKGTSLIQIGYYQDAIALFEIVIKANPQLVGSWVNKSYCEICLKDYSAAHNSLEIAKTIDPKSENLWVNKGYLSEILDDQDEALLAYSEALKINSKSPQANLNIGQIYLSKFDFQKGWPKYALRHETEKLKYSVFRSTKKKWNTKDVNKKIYLWSEQGIGDQILHCTILPELKSDNHYLIGLDRRLINVMKRSLPTLQFIEKISTLSTDSYDQHLPLGDLLSVYRPSLESFKFQKKSYLISNREQVLGIRKKLKSNCVTIGLSWFSSNPQIGLEKSIFLNEFIPLFKIKNLNFIDLQYGDTTEERRQLFDKTGFELKKFENIDSFNDIDGLISLIDSCDYIVTISNTTAHLSGALGKPTFLLSPRSVGKLWYWHERGDYSIWYPSVKIFRQDEFNSWEKAITSIKNLIEQSSND